MCPGWPLLGRGPAIEDAHRENARRERSRHRGASRAGDGAVAIDPAPGVDAAMGHGVTAAFPNSSKSVDHVFESGGEVLKSWVTSWAPVQAT